MTTVRKRFMIVAATIIMVGSAAVAASATGSNPTPRTFRYSACLQASTKTLVKVVINRRAACTAGERAVSWNATGPAGAKGTTGTAGTTWTTGTAAPTSASAQDGDLYFDVTSGEVYEVVGGTWTAEGNLHGPTGDAGANGTNGSNGFNGANGASVVTSATTPTGACSTGDTDIELDNGEVWSCTAAVWVDTGSSLQGPTGAPGPTSLAALQGSACTYDGSPSTVTVTQDPTTGTVSITCTPLLELSITVTNGPISSLEITVMPLSGPGGPVGNENASFLSTIGALGDSGSLIALSGSAVTGGGSGFTYTCDGGSTQSAIKTSGSTSGIYYAAVCNYAALTGPFPMSVDLP